MCIKCLLLQVLAEREAQFTSVGEEALARGEEIHEELADLDNPFTVQASQPEYDEYTLLGMERNRADISNMNADAILKLANAAKALYTANLDTSGVLRTLENLYYPATPDVVSRQEGQTEAVAPETPASDDVLDPLPPELIAHIAELKAAGLDVEVVRVQL